MKNDNKPNKIRFSNSLISVAYNDLLSARILYLNDIHHNALFFLQQSIEKLVKAIALDLGIKEISDMRRINHSPHKVYKSQIDESLIHANAIEENPTFKKSISKLGEVDSYIAKVKHTANFFENLHKVDLENWDEEELEGLLITLEEHVENDLFEIEDNQVLDQFKEVLFEALNWRPNSEEESKLDEGLKSGFYVDINTSKIQLILAYLSLITSKHENMVRYPCQRCGESPIKNYNKNNPLIKYFGNIFNLQLHCIHKYDAVRMSSELIETHFEEE